LIECTALLTGKELVEKLGSRGIRITAKDDWTCRAVTHYQVFSLCVSSLSGTLFVCVFYGCLIGVTGLRNATHTSLIRGCDMSYCRHGYDQDTSSIL